MFSTHIPPVCVDKFCAPPLLLLSGIQGYMDEVTSPIVTRPVIPVEVFVVGS